MECVSTKRFQDRVAIVNAGFHKGPLAWAMKYLKDERILSDGHILLNEKDRKNNARILKDNSDKIVQILKAIPSCYIAEAILLHRPYIRIAEGQGPIEGTVSFKVDGVVVCEAPVNNLLVQDLSALHLDVPFEWKNINEFFQAVALKDEAADGSNKLGIFAPASSLIEAFISDYSFTNGDRIRLEAGILAATYTRKNA
jgi:hypothetical protein